MRKAVDISRMTAQLTMEAITATLKPKVSWGGTAARDTTPGHRVGHGVALGPARPRRWGRRDTGADGTWLALEGSVLGQAAGTGGEAKSVQAVCAERAFKIFSERRALGQGFREYVGVPNSKLEMFCQRT